MERKLAILKNRQGSVLLETVTYRIRAFAIRCRLYRTRREGSLVAQDSIQAFRSDLVLAGLIRREEFDAIDEFVVGRSRKPCAWRSTRFFRRA
jgi:TPP-dependent pyruvate/acetoin dehydrogenase alpha subunit